MDSPLSLAPVFQIGPVGITMPVLVSWAIIAALALFARLATRHLALRPGKTQAVLELLVTTIDGQIRDTMRRDPAPYRALIGTIFVFVLVANWSSLIPGIEPPTAHLETDTALALTVFAATIWFGISARGLKGYLATFAEPSWVMIPLNLIEQITRTFSLIVRLFGNVMSGVFVIGIVLTLAGLFVPIPLMALDLLTGAVQAYIFAVLATVFIGAAAGETEGEEKPGNAAGPQSNNARDRQENKEKTL
ncbi:MAG TPA: F0F1 ATP synthase subunit A [Rhodobacterales bacterium]|nr:F0F1 ATP synthase subunit A [Rhodobacterales bacterium]